VEHISLATFSVVNLRHEGALGEVRPYVPLGPGVPWLVLDWEISGLLDLAGELGSTALSLSKGHGFDDIEHTVFRSVLDGYVAGGGALPPAGPSWFVFMIEGWLLT
jgi:hypothetical protein